MQMVEEPFYLHAEIVAQKFRVGSRIGDENLGFAAPGNGLSHACGQQGGDEAGIETAHGIADEVCGMDELAGF